MKLPLKILILISLGLSLLAAWIPQFQGWLALSWEGIEHFYLWQLVTYVFVEPGPFSLSFFIQLAFNMYLLWIFGASLIERSHPLLFFALYFGATLIAGLVALAFPQAILAGSTPAVYAVLVAWMMLNVESRLLLFSAIPFKAHWLIVGLIGITFFIDISNSRWLECATLGASLFFAYLFAIMAWRTQSPFAILRPFERKMLRLLEPKKQQPYSSSKIYDIKSGAPILNDDQFMDAMLDQISRLGEDSLTTAEKKRMKEISEKKK